MMSPGKSVQLNPEEPAGPARRDITRAVLIRFGLGVPLLGLLLLLPAGTVAYWQAWVYLGVIVGLLVFAFVRFLRLDPQFLARRIRTREKERAQRWVVALSGPVYVALFVVPALDVRFGWSHVPARAVLAADLVAAAGYGLILRVFDVNRFAGRTVEVEEAQVVIATGPYAIVRHPMYLGVQVMFTATPIALGSYWGVIVALPLAATLVARILDEERVLVRDLPGYTEYRNRTRFRLIPGIW